MRSFAHLTPAYVTARVREMVDHRLRPEDPWLTREAINLLDGLLRPVDVALEFGAGRSTRWIARRVARVTSVESDAGWHARVVSVLAEAGLSNVELIRRARDVEEPQGANAAYVRVLEGFGPESVDFVLVDGIYRGYCAVGSIAKVRRGGIIAVDNVNWYLPSKSRSPNARSLADGPADEAWGRFADATADWRRIWTSSGVTDTLILFKP